MRTIEPLQPFSQDVIFVDTEFSSLDPYKGEILSIGMIKPNGEEFYVELEYEGEVSDWVEKHILAGLTQQKVSRAEAVALVREFVGPDKPYMITYVTHYDEVYLRKLFGQKDCSFKEEDYPFNRRPIDFASILFGVGLDPEEFGKKKQEFCRELEIDADKYVEHNALDDARLLREVYFKLVEV